MKLFLSNVFKGLLVSLLVITLGGFLYINISKPEEINLQLISSSVVNQLGTESKNLKETKKEKENNENKVLVDKDKEEKNEENKVEDKEASESTTKEETKTEEPKEEQTKVEDRIDVPKVEEKPKEEVKETPKVEASEPPKEEVKENNQSSNNNSVKPKGGYAPNLAAVQAATVKNTYVGLMTAYGPDCVGCGGMVAHGEYVGGGNIYYNDKTFGSIRIVAGDRSLGFGTIIRIKGISSEPIIAVMLDTGGAIGFDKGTYFDLLYESEAAASSFGRPKATFEILRYGF